MRKKEAFAFAKKAFNDLEPHQMSSVCSIGKGPDGVVVIALHDSDQSIVLWNEKDLSRVINMCQIQLMVRENKRKRGRSS
jgi:hypothetical protein